jgi:hypothetical protein
MEQLNSKGSESDTGNHSIKEYFKGKSDDVSIWSYMSVIVKEINICSSKLACSFTLSFLAQEDLVLQFYTWKLQIQLCNRLSFRA